MQRYSEVIGKDVVLPNGKRLGEVKEVLFLSEKLEFTGIVLGKGSFEISKRTVARENIVSIDKEVLVRDLDSLKKIKRKGANDTFKSTVDLKGMPVCIVKGKEIGFIEDVLFNFKTGHIEGIELGDGLLHDVMSGRKVVPLIGKSEIAGEHMLVSKEAVEEIIESRRGINKYLKEV